MLDLYQEVTVNQYLASFATLADCIDQCSDKQWDKPVGNHAFDQVVFHTLFFADVYLSIDLATAKQQSFHSRHSDNFEGYEELGDDAPQRHYSREFVVAYLDHCRAKAETVVGAETEESLTVRPGFDWQKFSRAELHVYNIRHIHHHVAQLSLALRRDQGAAVDWVRSGWE